MRHISDRRSPRPSGTRFSRIRPARLLATSVLAASTVVVLPGVASAATGGGATYVAMGDSYSSGESLGSYLPGSDTSSDSCHRSTTAYPEQLAAGAGESGSFDFVACSGAVTSDLFTANHEYSSEPAQDLALGSATKLVTLTIGGNDLGFTTIAEDCLDLTTSADGIEGPGLGEPGSWGCAAKLTPTVDGYLADLAGTATGTSPDGTPIHSISSVLADIHAKAPHAHIYLAGYPYLFGSSTAGYTPDAFDTSSGLVCDAIGYDLTFDEGDAQWARSVETRLATIDRQAVAAAVAAGVKATYVDPDATFSKHGLCGGSTAWINGIQLATDGSGVTISGSFHPDQAGHTLGYTPAFRTAGF